MIKRHLRVLAGLLVLILVALNLGACQKPLQGRPTALPTTLPTASITPTPSQTPTQLPTVTMTPTATATATSTLAMTGTIAGFKDGTQPTNEIVAFAPCDDGHEC